MLVLVSTVSVFKFAPMGLVLALLVDLCVALPALGAGPQDRVRATINAVSAILEDPALQRADKDAERRQRVQQIIFDAFDFRLRFSGNGQRVARSALGQLNAAVAGLTRGLAHDLGRRGSGVTTTNCKRRRPPCGASFARSTT